MLWGIDISDHQPSFDLYRTRQEGFDFAIFKATEGSTWRAQTFAANLHHGRRAGLLCAAYHYVRSTDVPGQAGNIQAVVPRDCPLILDVEEGAGPLSVTRDLTHRLRAAGYRLPLMYLPKWYADKIGARDLRGLPPLWYSRYPTARAGDASDVYARNAAWLNTMWGGYYGLHVEILQFSDQGIVAGRSPIDVNAYRGTREQLAALLGGSGNDEVDMATINELYELVRKYSGGDAAYGYTLPRSPERFRSFSAAIPPRNGRVTGNEGEVFASLVAGENAEIQEVYAIEDWAPDGKPGKKYPLQRSYKLVANDRQSYLVPALATQICVVYRSDCDLSLSVEIDAKWK